MRELVLTGIRDFWPQEEKEALFLGPWCFAHHHAYGLLDSRRFPLAPSPYTNTGDLLQASRYVDELVDRMTGPLARLMNGLHGLTFSERFWQTFLSVWLVHWVGILYDRYLRLDAVERNCEERFSVRILPQQEFPIRDFRHLMHEVARHGYNLLLLSEMIRLAGFRNLTPVTQAIDQHAFDGTDSAPAGSLHRSAALVKAALEEKLAARIDAPVRLGNVYGLSWADRLSLYARSGASLRLRAGHTGCAASKDVRNRLAGQRLDFGARDRFESALETMLPSHMPTELFACCASTAGRAAPAKVWIGNDIYRSEEHAYRIASTREHGGKWISCQHGGGYGNFASFPIGKIEYATADGFVTWGWDFTHIYASTLYPLPSPMLSKLTRHKEENEQLFFLGTMHPAYAYRLHSALPPDLLPEYLENKLRFLRGLKEDIRPKVLYRPYFDDYGTKEEAAVRTLLTGKQFMTRGDVLKRMGSCRLAVIDHLSTGCLQAFTMGVPTILYWDPAHFAITREAQGLFDALRSAGILFDQPEAAADKANQVWENAGSWWQGASVQKAVARFCATFARSSRLWRREWLQFLKQMISEELQDG